MNRDFWFSVRKLNIAHRRRSWWYKAVAVLSAIVVFCTGYILILPAITLNDTTYCGLEEHQHGPECIDENGFLICDKTEHIHTDECRVEPGEEKQKEETEPQESGVNRELNYKGEDYSVKLIFTDNADIPDDAELKVREIKKNSLKYNGYFQKTEDFLKEKKYSDISGARFFDITILSDGREIEPDESVNVSIHLNDPINVQEGGSPAAIHFGSKETQLINVSTERNGKVDDIGFVQDSFSVTGILNVNAAATYYVWLDGTNGGLMNLYDSPNTKYTVTNGRLTLPTTWTSPSKYNYKLKGWYNINSNTYYAPGETATINRNTVFYAEWEAASYDFGQNNEHVAANLDTSDFIRTKVFDYSTMFNMESVSFSGNADTNGHSETWSLVKSGNTGYGSDETFDFIFRDWDAGGSDLSYPGNLDTKNDNQSNVTQNIISDISNNRHIDIIDKLFNPDNSFDVQTKQGVLGKSVIGNGNYLYQYMDYQSEKYDGRHNGYYYYDSALNAASYNKTDDRFYVYDYLERTSDSPKDSSGTVYGLSDFLPFNSPYNYPSGKNLVRYNDSGATGSGENYQYDAKYDGQQSASGNVVTNYWYGISSEIDFFLPHNTGETYSAGNYKNKSLTGQELVFEFSGDDDVWVFVDGNLTLDIGGIHGVRKGNINFSTGKATVYTSDTESKTQNINLNSGEHELVIYYLERGGSQSNCSIYFNITPRYALTIQKIDSFTEELLTGAEFSLFQDAACTVPAQLWTSKTAFESGDASTNVFLTRNGVMHCWGFIEGNTYYIKESKPPGDTDYPQVIDDVICLTLGTQNGLDSYVGNVSPGEDGIYDEGFEVKHWSFDQDSLSITFDITNSKIGSKPVMIEKVWDSAITERPDSITVYVAVDGEQVGYEVELNDSNNWKHIWYGLPKFNERNEEIEYTVEEPWISGMFYEVVDSTFTTLNNETETKYIMTNKLIDNDNLTELKVDKTWLDGGAHVDDEVKIHLVANGVDTRKILTLNYSNNWTGVFEEIPYRDSDDNIISYTVTEERIPGFDAEYSATQEDGKTDIVSWGSVTGITDGKTYRFVSGNLALANNSDGQLVTKAPDSTDEYQRWEYTSSKLKNVGSGKYLAVDKKNFTMKGTGSNVSLNSNRIRYQQDKTTLYINIAADGKVSGNDKNGTSLTTYLMSTSDGNTKYKVSVTNDVATYIMPSTGGSGYTTCVIGGLLLMIISLLHGYIMKYSRKRRDKT